MKTVSSFLRHTLSFFLLLFSYSSSSFCIGSYFYKQITLDAGLPTTLTCIFADAQGFVWSGTPSGLGRFNGHEQKRYIHQPGDTTSLPGNHIYQITQDVRHRLWVLTDRGVACYDYRSNRFTTLKDGQGEACVAYSVCWQQGQLWFGGKNAVYCYDETRGRLVRRHELGRSADFDVVRLCPCGPHRLLCGSRWQGICSVDLPSGQVVASPFGCGDEISDLFVDSRQRVWIAPYNQGLRCFAADGRELASYSRQNSALGSDIVICLAERDRQIWIGTDGGGIDVLDPESGLFTPLVHVPGDKSYSLPTNSVNCLHCDPYGNIWVGGVYNGLIGIRAVFMKTYTDAPFHAGQGLSHPIVLSLYRQGSDCLWIGTDGGGLNRFDPLAGRFASYPTTQGDKVTSICPFAPGKLLLSLFAQGLFVFDVRTGQKVPFGVIDEQTTRRLSTRGYSVYLHRNTPRTLLILSDHVYIYDLERGTFSIAREEKEHLISWGTLQAVETVGGQTYLFDKRRLYALDHETERLTVIYAPDSGMQIQAVSMDPEKGCFWIGSNQGVSCYMPRHGRLQPVVTNLFASVSTVVCHPGRSEVWIGADNRLFVYLPAEQRFILLGESDGVMPNEYIPRARLVDGEDLYLGGVRGLLHIGGDWRRGVSADAPELQLSDIILNGRPVTGVPAAGGEVLSVPWNSHVALQLMAREEDIFRQKLYRYRIAGLDGGYTETYNAELLLRALPVGRYRIMASCTAKDGNWTADRQVLELVVMPPWYRTWWFVGGCCLLVCLLVTEAVRRMLQGKERRLKWAMKEHEQQVYEEKVRFLINISHELRTPLTLIYAPLGRMLKSLPRDDERYDALQAVYRQSQRMKALINMVLDVRKMEVGQGKLHIRFHRLNEWVEQVSHDFAREGEAEQVHLLYQLDPRIGWVGFDREKCETVLSNLLVNALKHSPQNSTITVVTELLDDRREVRIRVSDQGCGLKQVDTGKLFTRFYQGNGEQGGTGIGLSYSKLLVEQQGGSMGVWNNPAEDGATFYFSLPLMQEEEERACKPGAYLNELIEEEGGELPAQERADREFPLTSYTLLLVDDHPELTAFLKKAMGEYFGKVVVASDGQEALGLLKTHQPDVVVSDVMMPRMNGNQLCMCIKEDVGVSHIPVILLTARHDEQSQQTGYKSGADAYLLKPFEVETLVELIRSLLKARDAIRRRYMDAGPLPVPQEATFSQTDEKFLFRLNKLIEQNLGNSGLDVAFICREVGMSRASLYNKLKVLTSMSANEYVNKFRMERAIVLMQNTELTFADIAEQVGFASSSYFSTAFKQYTGETPTQYRKKVLGG